MGKKVVIAGATGLVGKELTRILLDDDEIREVVVLTRRPLEMSHPKLNMVETDFRDQHLLEAHVKGDALFCCLGTTMKKAKTREAFEWVDLELPLLLGKVARKNRIPSYMLLTALGANPESKIFYNRTKGKVEQAITDLEFEKLIIFRPSLLLGKRDERRIGESVGQYISKNTEWLMTGPLRKYRPIEGRQVAEAMIHYFRTKGQGIHTISSEAMNSLV